MWNHNGAAANPFGFQNQNNAWNQGMPQPGVWGFQQQQAQIPNVQQFLPGPGMIPPQISQNYFPNSAHPLLSNPANVIQNQAFARFQPPHVPSLPHQTHTAPNPFSININRPPPPPPEIVAPPPGNQSGGFNRLGGDEMTNSFGRRAGDWNCSQCQNHNYAWRKSCGRCNCDREVGEEPQNQAGSQSNEADGRSSSSAWQCPRCKIFNAGGPTHCTQCQLINPNTFGSPLNDLQRQAINTPAVNETNQKPSDEEEQFDRMFSDWEAGFESWKRENQNNSDQIYVQQHIYKMNEMRVTMLKRRENLKRQRQETGQNKYSNSSTSINDGEPSKKMPRLFNTPQDNAGRPPVPRKPSRWEQNKEDGNLNKKRFDEAKQESGTNDASHSNKDRRQGDWDCMRCNKVQFAFRLECKFCNLSKTESDNWKREGLKREAFLNQNRNERKDSSSKSLFQTRQDLERSSAHKSSVDENLFQRRDPANPQADHSQHSSGPSFVNSFDDQNSKTDYKTSAKVVEYGHGNKQVKPPWAGNEDNRRKEWSPKADSKNNQRNHHRYDNRHFQQKTENRDLNLTAHKPYADSTENAPHHEPKPTKPPPVPQGDKITIDDLIKPPGRNSRPSKLVIIFRGLPGAGKTFLVKHIKSQESEMGGEAPKTLSLDDYFECDGKYEYEEEMEKVYQASLIKAFKKQVDDGYFPFILVDSINDKTEHYQPMWSYAKQKGFEVYIGNVECDPGICFTRNVHERKEKDIQALHLGWEATPAHFNKVEFSSFLQDKGIENVEMADAENDDNNSLQSGNQSNKGNDETKDNPIAVKLRSERSSSNDKDNEENIPQSSDAKEMGEEPFALPSSSKWEVADRQEKMAKLDGVSVQAIKRMADAHHSSINDWLEIESEVPKETGRKKVRWADIEERRKQVKLRDIGFVVGQTNWKRLMDPNEGTQQALERTKIIPNRFDNRS